MKKTTSIACRLVMLALLLAVLASNASAQTVINSPTPKIGWDALSVPNLPATSEISYDYGYKLTPATVPTVMGNVTGTTATYSLSIYGTYALCVRGVLKDSGMVKVTSGWACSDVTANCQGGQTFVASFWPTLQVPGNLTPLPVP